MKYISFSVFGNNTACFSFTVPSVLEPVTNISSSIDNCSNISITWDSPKIDDCGVSIQHYLLTIYDNITGQKVMDALPVYLTKYHFEDKNKFIYCYTYVITGVNELGERISNKKTESYQKSIVSLLL